MQSNILKRLNHERAQGRATALVTILSTQGSTPRKAGSQMLVFADGSIFGTIGGGLAEGRSIQAAQETLKSGASSLHSMTMDASVAAADGMACGGEMEIFVQYVAAPGDE
ncbi:MAG: XdhC family protein [Candidatus Adiutrix sp.]|jgi:xanthine dehydrogenase accessory factor|nr:XdhC family protein [Candidatus Adiutrix sp.]